MKGFKFVSAVTLVILLSLAAVIWFYPPSEDFGKQNPFWNGLKDFYSEFKASSIDSLDELPADPADTVLVSIPYLKFSQKEIEGLKEFVSQGGILVLLADGEDGAAYGNEILKVIDPDFSFSQYNLLDPLSNDGNEWYPTITKFASQKDYPISNITEGIKSIVLNHAIGLNQYSEDQVVAKSSQFSFIDLNRNSNWDDEDGKKGDIPVAAALPVDNGYVVVVSDPSILINSMLGKGDNSNFIRNITRINSLDPEILVDQSHLPKTSLYDAKDWLVTARGWFSSTPALSGVVAVALIVTLHPLWTKKTKDQS